MGQIYNPKTGYYNRNRMADDVGGYWCPKCDEWYGEDEWDSCPTCNEHAIWIGEDDEE